MATTYHGTNTSVGQPGCWALIAVFVAGVLLIGCGKRDTAQVSGRVIYQGSEQVPGDIRIIRFEPTVDTTATVHKAASGEIEPDGRFQLYTRVPGDGVYLGRYAVTFSILSSATGGRLLVKPEYMQPESTPYVVDVTGDRSDLVFEIEPR